MSSKKLLIWACDLLRQCQKETLTPHPASLQVKDGSIVFPILTHLTEIHCDI